jgi:hypothetical protein
MLDPLLSWVPYRLMGLLFPSFAQLCLACARFPASLFSMAAPQPSAGNPQRTQYGATFDCATFALLSGRLREIDPVSPSAELSFHRHAGAGDRSLAMLPIYAHCWVLSHTGIRFTHAVSFAFLSR